MKRIDRQQVPGSRARPVRLCRFALGPGGSGGSGCHVAEIIHDSLPVVEPEIGLEIVLARSPLRKYKRAAEHRIIRRLTTMLMPADTKFTRPLAFVRGRNASAILASALALPLAGCGFNAYSTNEQVTEIINFSNLGTYHKLIVDNKVGDITIIADSSASGITAEIIKIGKGSTPENAQESLESIELILAPVSDEPGVFVCTSEFPRKWAGHSYAIDWRITAPADLALDLLSDVGDITAAGFLDGAAGRTDVGDITFKDIMGGVDLRTDVGDITVSSAGIIICSTDVGDISVTVLEDDYNADYKINLSSDVGDIKVSFPSDYRGLLNASTDVGDIDTDFHGIPTHSIISRSRRDKYLKAELNNASSPALEMHADVGDVDVDFYHPER